jgi:hypothetical protein
MNHIDRVSAILSLFVILTLILTPTLVQALTPYQSGYQNSILDGKASARDSSSACEKYNLTSDVNECFKGYDLGFKIGCDENHDYASYHNIEGQYDSCYQFYHHGR